jgi:hypothetical protein
MGTDRTSDSRAQPWKAAWPPARTNNKVAENQNQVVGFKEGETIVTGGVAGSFKRVLVDTAKNK